MRSRDEKTRLKAVHIYMRFWSGLHRHRPMSQRKTGNPYEVFDDVEMNDANLLSLLADAFPHLELREKPPPDEPDSGGPNRPVPVPPTDPAGSGGGAVPDGGGAPGVAEPSERARPRPGGTAAGS